MNHEPLHDLPWYVDDLGSVSTKREEQVEGEQPVAECETLEDAFYIAHAANAYPDLIRLVQSIARREQAVSLLRHQAEKLLRVYDEGI